ncbi:protein-S-isoprenylcysteine O-methyltransferase [Culicoides brevitarsis]|uniref:protein-S-isoprenylcysteine O-methyltransferase n=1 Tax=Culicoides brevitarsis TaxID=469753 RepID=UPI00307BF314
MHQRTLCHEGWISIYGFLSTAGPPIIFSSYDMFSDNENAFWNQFQWLTIFYFVVNSILRLRTSGNDYQILWRAALLGFVFSTGFYVMLYASTQFKAFGIYGMFLAVFHYSEYLGIAFSNPSTLSVDSFILNHSLHYHIAAVSSWIEFGLESYFFPQMKEFSIIWIIGALICFSGEVLRKAAMITASQSFTHVVQFEKAQTHRLVTNGVFSLVRHPSYLGWFMWSIGTQLILANPVCIVIYAVASWKFFNDRIFMEEITLLNFFGEEYYQYQQKVPTGLPFIKGYKTDL